MNAWIDMRTRHQAATLVRAWRRGLGLPLIILASTATSLRFAEKLSRDMPVAVLGNRALVGEWAPRLIERTRSPLELWREVKACGQLPYAVVSYPDQLVGDGPSFHGTTIDDIRYTFSIVEMMLLMRFRPPTFTGRLRFRGRGRRAASTLSLRPFVGEAGDMSTEAFDRRLSQLMMPVVECFRKPRDGWYAREFFALKLNNNFQQMLRLRLLEIEGLLRIAKEGPGSCGSYQAILAELQSARRKPLRSAG